LPVLIRDLGFEIINVNEHHVLIDILQEPPTRDPFDRLLLAHCQVEGLTLVTIDHALVAHPMAEKFSK
jgi:PIN domain nuclease of toxin-antitoxin system